MLSIKLFVIVNLFMKNIEWMSSTYYKKIIKAEGLILLTDIKCNISLSLMDNLDKNMPVVFNDSDIVKKSQQQFCLKHLKFCPEV